MLYIVLAWGFILQYFSFEIWFLIYFNFSENSFYKFRSILMVLFLKMVEVFFYFILSPPSEAQSLYKELISKGDSQNISYQIKMIKTGQSKTIITNNCLLFSSNPSGLRLEFLGASRQQCCSLSPLPLEWQD